MMSPLKKSSRKDVKAQSSQSENSCNFWPFSRFFATNFTNYWIIGALLWLVIGGCTAKPEPIPTATAVPLQPSVAFTPTPQPEPFRIVGYVTGETIISQIQFDKLTHINYAFLIPNEDGTFAPLANRWKLEEVVEKSHEQGVKVLISVGGWGWDAQFEAIAANPETRAKFIQELNAFVQQYNLDGADIDWEYPDPGPSAQNFLVLMQELNQVMDSQGKLLTSAVVALGPTGEGIMPDVFPEVDFLNLMAYDGSDTNHSPYEYAKQSLDYWHGRGLPTEKMVLGVPFYGRPNYVTYQKLIQSNPEAAQTDSLEYLGNTVYYNGIPTMRQKTELALQEASGIMIWALSYDTTSSDSLLNAIYQTAYGR